MPFTQENTVDPRVCYPNMHMGFPSLPSSSQNNEGNSALNLSSAQPTQPHETTLMSRVLHGVTVAIPLSSTSTIHHWVLWMKRQGSVKLCC